MINDYFRTCYDYYLFKWDVVFSKVTSSHLALCSNVQRVAWHQTSSRHPDVFSTATDSDVTKKNKVDACNCWLAKADSMEVNGAI